MIYKVLAILAAALCLAVTEAPAQSAPMTVRASADSTTLVQGDRTRVHVEVVKNGHDGTLINMPEREKDYYGLEMAEITIDSTDLGNGRMQLDYNIVFQAFDPADILTLPGFSYACDGDTVTSDILTFRVLPVDIPEELGNVEDVASLHINPDVPPVEVKSRFFDWFTDGMLPALVIILILAALAVCYYLYRKNGPKLIFKPKPIPPYELAMIRLDKMRETGMIEKSQPKEFFTEITDIFRSYLEGRFDIQALEMTTRQILKKLRENRETHLSADQMEQLLQISDYVKFAAMDPTPDERMRTYKTIYSFVESTRPAENTEADIEAKQGANTTV